MRGGGIINCREILTRIDESAHCGSRKCHTWRGNCRCFSDEFPFVENSEPDLINRRILGQEHAKRKGGFVTIFLTNSYFSRDPLPQLSRDFGQKNVRRCGKVVTLFFRRTFSCREFLALADLSAPFGPEKRQTRSGNHQKCSGEIPLAGRSQQELMNPRNMGQKNAQRVGGAGAVFLTDIQLSRDPGPR